MDDKTNMNSNHNDDDSGLLIDNIGGENNEEEIDPDNVDAAWDRIKSNQVFLDPPTTACTSTATTAEGESITSSCCTRLVLMSDTHGAHRNVMLPEGDVLIHGGDFSKMGEPGTIQDLDAFFAEAASKKFQQVICIAGNHDITFHTEYYKANWRRFHKRKQPFDHESIQASLKNCTYLQDSSCTLYNNDESLVYGSPWSPNFFNWAFNLDRGPHEIGKVWKQIPTDTDVLITHGPPLGRGDYTSSKMRAGCLDLLQEVQERVQPRLHVFGHIHEGYGSTFDGHTLYVNASNLDQSYQPVHPCIVVDLPHDRSKPAMIVQPQCTIQNASQLEQWLEEQGYSYLAALVKEANDDQNEQLMMPSGNDLLQESAPLKVCEALRLHRDKDSITMVKRALAKLYAQSFGRATVAAEN